MTTGVCLTGVAFFFVLSSDESESEDEDSCFFVVLRLADGGTATFIVDCTLAAGLSSSELLSLLDDAAGAFFVGCGGTDLTGVVGNFFFVLSSDESESDDESFFLILVVATDAEIAGFFTGDATAA